MLENALFLTLPITVFAIGALVVLLFTLGESERQLGTALVPVQVQRHERVPLALDGAGEPVQLMSMHQEFSVPRRIRLDMR